MKKSTHRAIGSIATTLAAGLATLMASSAIGATVAPEVVARDTLLDALAPALAVRGATASVTVAAPDARRPLAPCNRIDGFLPPGARLSGRTVVGVRCVDGATWQTFLTAEIRVEGPAWQTTRALRAGETLANGDVVLASAPMTAPDLDAATAAARTGNASTRGNAMRGLASIDGRLPAPYGRVVLRPVGMGRALTASDLRDEGRINAGEAVRVVYQGQGFSISSEGHSVGAADPGSSVMIRLAGGALVSGVLRSDRMVELPR